VHSYKSSEALISILRSKSFLLQHYGYGGHDPSLSNLQRSIGNAIHQLQAESLADGESGTERATVRVVQSAMREIPFALPTNLLSSDEGFRVDASYSFPT